MSLSTVPGRSSDRVLLPVTQEQYVGTFAFEVQAKGERVSLQHLTSLIIQLTTCSRSPPLLHTENYHYITLSCSTAH